MASFGDIAAGAGTILSGASSLFSGIGAGKRQRKAQKWMEKMNKQNQQFQKDYTKYQNDLERENQELYWQKYNSPAAQRSAMEAAGINPFVEGSVMQPMQADSSVSGSGSPGYPTPPDYVTPGLGAIQDFGSSLSTLGARLDSIKADTELKNAQTAKVQSETIAQNNENSLFGMVRQSAELDVLSKRYRNALDKINVEWSSIEKMQDAAQKDASTQELLARVKNELSQAAKTDADRQNQQILTSALEKMYNAETTLKGEQAKTEGVKRSNISMDTALKSDERRQIGERIKSMAVERGVRITEREQAILDTWMKMQGLDRATSLAGLIDKYRTNRVLAGKGSEEYQKLLDIIADVSRESE